MRGNRDLYVLKRVSVLQVLISGDLRLLIYIVGLGC